MYIFAEENQVKHSKNMILVILWANICFTFFGLELFSLKFKYQILQLNSLLLSLSKDVAVSKWLRRICDSTLLLGFYKLYFSERKMRRVYNQSWFTSSLCRRWGNTTPAQQRLRPLLFMTNWYTEVLIYNFVSLLCLFLLECFTYMTWSRFQNSANAVPAEFPVISSSHQVTVTGTSVSQKLLELQQLLFHFNNQIL